MEMKSDTAKIERLLPQTERPPQNKSFFKKHLLLIVGIVGTVLFGSALIYFTVLSPLLFPEDQKTISANAPEAHLQAKPSCTAKRVVGYYPGSLGVNTGQLRKLTHIIFEYVKLDWTETLKFESEARKETFLEMKKKAREVNKDLKVMVSIGGWDQSQEFPRFFNSPIHRKNLLDAILSLVKQHEIDGIDIFWIHLDSSIKQVYLEFVQELHKNLINLGRETSPFISISVSPFKNILENRYLWKELIEEVEFINVITYGYFNSMSGTFIGPTAPIYGGNRENVDSSMKYVTCKTGNPHKLNLVVPFYGYYWTKVSSPFSENNFVWITPDRYLQNWHLYESDRENQRVRFRHLEEFWKQWPGAEYHFHNESKSSYYWIPESKTFITIESEESLREKVKYQNQMNIGGIGIMTIQDDDDENTLLNVIAAEEENCLPDNDGEVKYDCQTL